VLQQHDAATKAVALASGTERPVWVFPSLDGTPLEMWPSQAPIRLIANVIVCVGLLFWILLPTQIAGTFRRRRRS
jgi:hypothetical protein